MVAQLHWTIWRIEWLGRQRLGFRECSRHRSRHTGLVPPREPLFTPLDRKDYARHGLFSLRGVVTHPLGDDYAQRVLRDDPTMRDDALAGERRRVIEMAQRTGRPVATSAKRRTGTWGR